MLRRTPILHRKTYVAEPYPESEPDGPALPQQRAVQVVERAAPVAGAGICNADQGSTHVRRAQLHEADRLSVVQAAPQGTLQTGHAV